MILPISSSVWGCCSKELSQKLQKLQNCVAHGSSIIMINTAELLRNLKWNKLDQQRAVAKAVLMKNALNNRATNYLNTRFFPRNAGEFKILNITYLYHSGVLIMVNEVLVIAELSYGGASLPKEVKQSQNYLAL